MNYESANYFEVVDPNGGKYTPGDMAVNTHLATYSLWPRLQSYSDRTELSFFSYHLFAPGAWSMHGWWYPT